eukprot:TRINITY_DN18897_c0_g1_i1.p1 TRINITY_DN18897_c0_g1~~TRINITY_DN18897_c0_g1_i1.p1  ORF type:complete len:723 (-),score=135.51 TRINITY_DN18897_c0_g1_i1:287-2455(-)
MLCTLNLFSVALLAFGIIGSTLGSTVNALVAKSPRIDYVYPFRVRLNTATPGYLVGERLDQPGFTVSVQGVTLNTVAVNNTHLSVVIPSYSTKGYVPVTLTDSAGNTELITRALYYSDDCLVDNTYGVDGQCRVCPAGGWCPGGDRLWAREGYYASVVANPGINEAPFHLQECYPAGRCRGGPHNPCKEGYTGLHCGSCAEGYAVSGDTCQACKVGDFLSVQLTFILFISGIVLVCILLDDRLLSTVVSTLMAMQIIAAVGRMATFAMPPWFMQTYSYLAIINLDVEVMSPQCLGIPFTHAFLLLVGNIALVLTLVIVLTIILFALSIMVPPRRAHFRDRIRASWFVLINLSYYIITLRAIQSLFCIPMGPSGERYLVNQPDFLCYTTKDSTAILLHGIAVFVLLFFTLGTPMWFVAIMGRMSDADKKSNVQFMARYGPVFDSFKTKHMAFGCTLLLLDQLLAAAGATLKYMPLYQVAAVAGVLVIYLFMLLFKRPFKSKLELTAMICAVGTAAVVAALNATVSVLSTVDENSNTVQALSQDEDEKGFSTDDPVLFGIAITVIALTFLSFLTFIFLFCKRVQSVITRLRYRSKGKSSSQLEAGLPELDEQESDLSSEMSEITKQKAKPPLAPLPTDKADPDTLPINDNKSDGDSSSEPVVVVIDDHEVVADSDSSAANISNMIKRTDAADIHSESPSNREDESEEDNIILSFFGIGSSTSVI